MKSLQISSSLTGTIILTLPQNSDLYQQVVYKPRGSDMLVSSKLLPVYDYPGKESLHAAAVDTYLVETRCQQSRAQHPVSAEVMNVGSWGGYDIVRKECKCIVVVSSEEFVCTDKPLDSSVVGTVEVGAVDRLTNEAGRRTRKRDDCTDTAMGVLKKMGDSPRFDR
ncbi:hypothetical protein F5I97DRAFT_1826704 [Phlebopus sp. FC_14]|nr:hypothetical protein F5I97DRAFT_1826704 [Phlebopus sp. FC_14]